MMNAIKKQDIMSLVGCFVLFAVMQAALYFDFIGAFWELNIVLIGINIAIAYKFNKSSKVENENKVIVFKGTKNIFTKLENIGHFFTSS